MSNPENFANQIDQALFPRKKIHIHGVEFDEDFLSESQVSFLSQRHPPTFS
jgi:hypothetical protein